METFTSSRGKALTVERDGTLMVHHERNSLRDWGIGAPAVDDLREFFQAERDEKMGVWRSPFIAGKHARKIDDNRVRIVDEATGAARAFTRGYVSPMGEFSDLAKHYFKAHPIHRPWHDAVAGEIWAVTWGGRESACRVIEHAGSDSGLMFDDSERETPGTHAPVIKAAHRIWPEVTK